MVTSCLRFFCFFLFIVVSFSNHVQAMFTVKHHFSEEAPASPRIVRRVSSPAANPNEPAQIRREDELKLLKELSETLAFSEQVHVAIFNDCSEDLFLSIKDPFENDYHPSLIIKAGHEVSFDILAGAPLLLKAMPINVLNPKFYKHRIDNNFSNITTNISTWTPPSLRNSPLRFASHQNLLTSPSASTTSSPRSSSPERPRFTQTGSHAGPTPDDDNE